MLHVPRTLPMISRRRALVSAAALALLGATAACGTTPPSPDYTDLTAAMERARADAALADDAAAGLGPTAPGQRALIQVSAERSAHAKALSDELTRIAGPNAEKWAASATATSTSTPPDAPAGHATVGDVVAALTQSARHAAELAAKLSGYRAGLLGSVAAACTAAYTVALGGAR
jgi:hypothetical protein